MQLLEENRELHREKEGLKAERDHLKQEVYLAQREKFAALKEAKERGERLSDIPMPDVMERLGYGREQQGEAHVYRDAQGQGQIALRVEQQKMYDSQNRLLCCNSLDLVVHMRRNSEGIEGFTHAHALEYLRQEFGDKRAAGAAVVHREKSVLEYFDRRREQERSLVHERGNPWRGSQGGAEDHDRHSRNGRDDCGGGRSYGFDR